MFNYQHPALFHADNFADPRQFALELLTKATKKRMPKTVIEIGATVGENIQDRFPKADYKNLDLQDSDKIPTIVGDVTEELPIEENSIDFVFSNDAFEHIHSPWLAAAQIENILRPGGYVFIATLFAWRFHPVPDDYWRFTPSALAHLFPNCDCIQANFNAFHRREDARGHWGSKKDSVPIDMMGGWRENWKVYYFGHKR